MPRVNTKTKNKGGKTGTYSCGACQEPIVAGEQYYEWSFRYGGTHRQHTTHGPIKQSQLTRSKMSEAYAAIESAEEYVASAESKDDIESALQDCASEIDSVKGEYEESLENMGEGLSQGSTGQEIQEKVEALEAFKDELESFSPEDFDQDEPEEPEEPKREACSTDEEFERLHEEWKAEHSEWATTHEAWSRAFEEYLDGIRDEANEVLGNLSI